MAINTILPIGIAVLFFLLLIISGGVVFYLLRDKKRRETSFIKESIENLQKNLSQDLSSNQQELKQTFRQTTEFYSKMQRELGKLQEIGNDMKGLQTILQSPKLRGNLGEQVLRDLLEQIIPHNNFKIQYTFQSGEIVDAILKTDNGIIPIDSKYSLESFRKMKEVSKEEKKKWEGQFKRDIKKHLDDISRKYIRPSEGTVDFAVMYLPSEAVYYEILVNYPDILNYSYQQKVYLVSPNTFYYFLKVILVGLEGAKIEETTRKILSHLQSLQGATERLGGELQVLSTHIRHTQSTSERVEKKYAQMVTEMKQISSLEDPKIKQIEK